MAATTARNIYKRLVDVQNELHAPKGSRNTFGKYNYRSAEDILEAVKPLLLKHGLALFITDTILEDYLQATVRIVNVDNPEEFVENTAYAKIAKDLAGMSPAQVTGATSSYARKYALNGLLLIDDNKDFDTNEYRAESEARQSDVEIDDEPRPRPRTSPAARASTGASGGGSPATDKQLKYARTLLIDAGEDPEQYVLNLWNVEFAEITGKQASAVIDQFKPADGTPKKTYRKVTSGEAPF